MAWQPPPPAHRGSLSPSLSPHHPSLFPCLPPSFSVCLCHLLKFPSATWLTFLPLCLFLDLSPNPSLHPRSSVSLAAPSRPSSPHSSTRLFTGMGAGRGEGAALRKEGRSSQVRGWKCRIGPVPAPLDVPLAKGSLKVKDSLAIGQVSVSQIINKWSLNLSPSRVGDEKQNEPG